MKKARKHMNFRLPVDLIERARVAVDERYQTLTDFVIMAIKEALTNSEIDK